MKKKNVNTNSNGDIVPELELNNKVLTLNPNDIKGVYLAWVYTGNERFEYNGNYQWKELIETERSLIIIPGMDIGRHMTPRKWNYRKRMVHVFALV